MSEQNKPWFARLYDAMNAADMKTLQDAIANDFVDHEEFPGLAPTKEGVIQLFTTFTQAFSGFNMRLDDMVAEGDKVFVRATMNGIHKGEFLGIAPTGRDISETSCASRTAKLPNTGA
jgi:predicted ester cyclase